MRLVWTERASLDIAAIVERSAELGLSTDEAVIERIASAPLILLERPRLGPAIGFEDLRKWPVRRTPFIMLYRVLDEAIEVLRVVHGMSDWRTPLS